MSTDILPDQRVTLITLGVRDLDASKAYYAAQGWHPAQEAPGVAFYRLHGLALALFGRDDLAADQGRAPSDLGTGAVTLAQNFRTEAEVDQAVARAERAGATVLKAPVAATWGGYSGYVADPDGHVWEFAVNPGWPLNDDGTLDLPEG